jgi:hypothetical protein
MQVTVTFAKRVTVTYGWDAMTENVRLQNLRDFTVQIHGFYYNWNSLIGGYYYGKS